MFDLIATVLAWFYSLWPSFGMSIVLLTIVVMVVATPLTLTGTRSMIKMQRLQPEMKRIQAKYKGGDREKMNQEMMAFYQANGINPVGGCLPLLVQMPIFIVLYQVVRGLTRRQSDMGQELGSTFGQFDFGGALTAPDLGPQNFNPAYLDSGSEMFQDLTQRNEMVSWGTDLARSASRALGDGFTDALPYLLLILIVFVTSLVQQRQIQGRNKNGQINPQQQMIMKILPFMLPVFSYGLAGGVVVYFVVSNLYRIGQQAYITRTLYGDNEDGDFVVPEPVADKPKKQAKGGGNSKKQKAGSSSSDNGAGRTATAARRGRTTAGQRAAQRSASTSSQKKAAGNSKADKPRGRGRSRRAAPDRNEEGRRANASGRTTPPGTVAPRARKKKKRK